MMFAPCSIQDIASFLERYHSSHTSPGRAIHCWCIKEGDEIKAAVACGPSPINEPNYVEIIADVILPGFKLLHTQLLSKTIGQLRTLRTYDLAYTWAGGDNYGPGKMFWAANWNYAGRYSRSPFVPNHRGEYVYWVPLKPAGKTMLPREPYPK